MAATFTIATNDIVIGTNATDTLANIKSVLEVPAPTNQGITITALDMTFDGTVSTNKPVLIQLIRATATGTFPSSSITPEPTSADGAAMSTLLTAANIKFGLASAEGTLAASTNGWRLYRLAPTAGVLYQFPLGRGIWVPKGTFFRVRMIAVNAVNVTINLEEEE